MPVYPAQIDNNTTLPQVVDNFTPVMGSVYNKLRDAVIAVEQELGVHPAVSYGTVRARLDALEGILNKLQSTMFGGDLAPTTPATQKVIGILGYPINSAAPIYNNYVLKWVNATWLPTQLTQDDILPPFSVILSGGNLAEVNQTISHPAFTATYSYDPPSLATFSDSEGGSQDVTSSPHAFNSDYNFTKTNPGDSVTFTLTATHGTATKYSLTSYVWGQKEYWGIGLPGQSGEAFIKSLATSQITMSLANIFTVNAPTGYKIYFAYRSAYGPATFYIGGFEGGFTLVSNTTSLTNDYGFTENYTLYESDNTGLGLTTVTVS